MVALLPLPVYAAEAEIYDLHEASIPVEFIRKQGADTEGEQAPPTSNTPESETINSGKHGTMPQTGEILQMSISFVGTLLLIGTLLLFKRRYKNE